MNVLYVIFKIAMFCLIPFLIFAQNSKAMDALGCRLLDRFDQLRDWFHQRAQSLRYRRLAGRCLKCHYDLSHNVSGTCPECGTPIAEGRCPRQ